MELCSRWVGVDLLERSSLASTRLSDNHELTYGKSHFSGFALEKRSLIMIDSKAFSLTGLEEWTTWILLGLLAVWGKCNAHWIHIRMLRWYLLSQI